MSKSPLPKCWAFEPSCGASVVATTSGPRSIGASEGIADGIASKRVSDVGGTGFGTLGALGEESVSVIYFSAFSVSF